jgi:adenosylcobinamide kinase/adenosylcobinamide-phosphate guanylyltransferase
VLPAAHAHGNGDALAEEAVLFDVTAPDGQRLLYATDTATLPASTIAGIAGRLNALLIDETFGDRTDHGTGHLDLAKLPPLLATLRSTGSVSDSTIVVATHLSHHNPPTPVLRQRLSALGVQVVDDFTVIDTRRPYGRAATHRLVLGGARSGKSHVAEGLAADGEHIVYVATGGNRPDDPEWAERVAEHRARRPAEWTTIETTEVTTVLLEADAASTLLVDCLALWLTAQLDETDAWSRAAAGDRRQVHADIVQRIDDLAAAVAACPADVILVSNEVGMGVVPATASGRLFRDLLGVLNVRVSRACDETSLVVAGHAFPLPARPGGPTHE